MENLITLWLFEDLITFWEGEITYWRITNSLIEDKTPQFSIKRLQDYEEAPRVHFNYRMLNHLLKKVISPLMSFNKQEKENEVMTY